MLKVKIYMQLYRSSKMRLLQFSPGAQFDGVIADRLLTVSEAK